MGCNFSERPAFIDCNLIEADSNLLFITKNEQSINAPISNHDCSCDENEGACEMREL
jgi:hypothetical protein